MVRSDAVTHGLIERVISMVICFINDMNERRGYPFLTCCIGAMAGNAYTSTPMTTRLPSGS